MLHLSRDGYPTNAVFAAQDLPILTRARPGSRKPDDSDYGEDRSMPVFAAVAKSDFENTGHVLKQGVRILQVFLL